MRDTTLGCVRNQGKQPMGSKPVNYTPPSLLQLPPLGSYLESLPWNRLEIKYILSS